MSMKYMEDNQEFLNERMREKHPDRDYQCQYFRTVETGYTMPYAQAAGGYDGYNSTRRTVSGSYGRRR